MRESCSHCHFTNLKRVGDISVGDQWGLSKDSPYEDDKGLSLVLVNSEKGKQIFECIEKTLKRYLYKIVYNRSFAIRQA